MAKKPVAKMVFKGFNDEKFERWLMTRKAHILMDRIHSIMTRSEMPFDGLCLCLEMLGIETSFDTIVGLSIVSTYLQKHMAKEEKQSRERLLKLGVRSGRVVLVP